MKIFARKSSIVQPTQCELWELPTSTGSLPRFWCMLLSLDLIHLQVKQTSCLIHPSIWILHLSTSDWTCPYCRASFYCMFWYQSKQFLTMYDLSEPIIQPHAPFNCFNKVIHLYIEFDSEREIVKLSDWSWWNRSQNI